ncbi:TolC family protein [Ancylothrix sp. C2]|uniref:TolC family protein n=1 Tax=Ancylothrix sp. D3o TaxID=2953691 RepID=UPI0021BADF3B|nr:TolC family protein [Ancylothrix sp. D3o]MCT7952336.1 TolC family protein [Ancylothrix sp. D3o]
MPSLRYLIAAGVGVALVLCDIKTGTSQTTAINSKTGQHPTPISNQSSEKANYTNLAQTVRQNQLPVSCAELRQRRENPEPQTTPNYTAPATLPEYLNPNPNPLQFPVKPSEVEIIGIQPITLQQAIELARRNNRDLQVAELELERSRAQLREAIAAEYPSLDLAGDITRSDSAQAQRQNELQQLLTGQDVPDETVTRSLSGQLELSYDVYTSGRRSATIRTRERQVELSQLEVERIEEQLRLDISNSYYDIQEAEQQIRISSQAVTASQQSLCDAEALERAGVGTRFDVLQAQVQLANEQQNLARAQRDFQVAQRQLSQQLSISLPLNITAADPVDIAGYWNINLEDSIIEAFKRRAELSQQLLQREISEQQRRVAEAATRPQVSVFANYNILEVFGDQIAVTDGYSLGARLRWNLYDGGASQARATQEDRNRDIAETRFADARNQVRFQVEQAYYDLQTNFENIQTASVEVERAREALRLARLRFGAGVGTQTDVINSETQLTRSEGNRIRAIIGYNRALAAMQRAVSNNPAGSASNTPPTPR